MVKRHQSLVPVARDHHEYLILARRLMQGSAQSAGSGPAGLAAQARAVAASFEPGLWHHFAVEEQAVFPAAATLGAEAAALVAQLTAEHRRIEELARQMQAGELTDATAFAALGALLNDHIRREDRALFPLMEARLSPAALLRLQEEVDALYP